MTSYQKRILAMALYWPVFGAATAIAWSISHRTLLMAAVAGSLGGAALAAQDQRDVPKRVVYSRAFQDESQSWIVTGGGRLLMTPLWPRILSLPFDIPETLWLLALTMASGLSVYYAWLGVVIFRVERSFGPILREALFPDSVGLPDVLRGWPVVVRTAEGTVGTTKFAGLVWEIRSATDEPLVQGKSAHMIAVEDSALLVLQQNQHGA